MGEIYLHVGQCDAESHIKGTFALQLEYHYS